MNDRLQIKRCPTCGNDRIERVVRDVTRSYEGHSYTVPAVEFYHCRKCGEKVYDREAMLKIEAFSPAYRKRRALAGARTHSIAAETTSGRATGG
ncbi:MAG: type II toxin-antitoxin system MqsA family antitoxin [Acidobacteriota bacterium]